MTELNNNKLERFGFSFKRGGAHSSRTMMLEELGALLAYVDNPEAVKADYQHAIDEENCLGKRSGKTRMLTYRHLVDLYSLDPSIILYRALLFFWQRDPAGQPLLALLCTYARDPIFRSTAPLILKFPQGGTITRVALEEFIDDRDPGRFSQATLKSTAQNINSTWTKSGHLEGRTRKIRIQATVTAGSVSYALLLIWKVKEFNNTIVNALLCNNINTMRDLRNAKEKDLKKIPMIGPKSFKKIICATDTG